MRNDTSARLAAVVALMSVILLGTTAAAVGYMLNVQAAYAVEAGSKQVQVQIPLLQIQVQDPGSDGGDKGGGSGDGGSNSGGDSGDHGGGGSGSGDNKGGQDSGSNDERNRQQDKDDNNNNDNGQGQYCYSVTVTNPLNGKTRTVDVCFDSRSDCEQAQQHDPDSEGGCESR